MPKRLVNWKFSDVAAFLKEHDFVLNYINASHHYYVGHYDGKVRQVCVPFHGSKALKPRTFKGIILQSGIPQKEWLK